MFTLSRAGRFFLGGRGVLKKVFRIVENIETNIIGCKHIIGMYGVGHTFRYREENRKAEVIF